MKRINQFKNLLLSIPAVLFVMMVSASPSTAQTTVTGSDGVKVRIYDTSRIITLGGDVTETVFALGEGDRIVAVDASSNYPAEVNNLPKVPYVRQLTAEGILSLSPTLIISTEGAEPKNVIQQIRAAGTPILMVSDSPTPEGAIAKLETIGKALSKEERASELISRMEAQLARASEMRERITERPGVMFVLSAEGQNIMAAGNGTSAGTIIELAGGTNALNGFRAYKNISAESIAVANPDVVLMMSSRAEQLGGPEGLADQPGFSLTDAAANERLVAMDGNLLLGFGPRLGEAVLELMQALHPELKLETAIGETR